MYSADDLALVRRLGQLTETVHAVVYFAPEARFAYAELGLRGYWRGYFASRCAAVGPIGPDLATALLGGFAPAMVARALPEVWSTADSATVVSARTSAATAALRRLLEGVDPEVVTTAAILTARCVEALALPGRPMAAAHRETPRPADPVGALWHDVTVLREHRGDGHLCAVAAAGLHWPEPHLLIGDRLDPTSRLTAAGPTRSGLQPRRASAAAARVRSTRPPTGWQHPPTTPSPGPTASLSPRHSCRWDRLRPPSCPSRTRWDCYVTKPEAPQPQIAVV